MRWFLFLIQPNETKVNMKKVSRLLLILSCSLLLACQKKNPDASAQESASASASPVAVAEPVKAAPAAELSDEQRELEEKKKLMDYAMMEDKYINDPRGQWASGTKASSTFGDEGKSGPSDSNLPRQAQGKVDGDTWTNNHQDIGFDWLETSYDKAVSANEVRVVFENGRGVEAISKIELQDPSGNWVTVWTGISDQKHDRRGSRTWFVRNFEKTAFKTKAVRVSLANNLERGYKTIDAVQLVGE